MQENDRPARNRATILKRLLLLTFGLLVGVLAAEVALRMLGVSYPLPYAPDPACGTRLQPGFRGWWTKEGRAFISINRHGFRHGEREPDKPSETVRIAVLGDSFIEALQVPDGQTFCAKLERELASSSAWPGKQTEVLNFGVSGFGTAQELLMLRHYVWDYQPDAVLLAFFAGNDLRNNSAALEPYQVRPFYGLVEDKLVLDDSFRRHPDYEKASSPTVRWKVAAISRIRILQLLNEIKNRPRQTRNDEPDSGQPPAGLNDLALAEPQDHDWRQAWQITERLILEVNREAVDHQVPFYLLVVGRDIQVHPDASLRGAFREQLGTEDLLYLERRLTELGETHGFPVITLSQPMLDYATEHKVHLHGFPNTTLGEGHWNSEGNRVAAEIVARAICPE